MPVTNVFDSTSRRSSSTTSSGCERNARPLQRCSNDSLQSCHIVTVFNALMQHITNVSLPLLHLPAAGCLC